jgi:NADH pyrophosphatase NudC (nudix superfamily)
MKTKNYLVNNYRYCPRCKTELEILDGSLECNRCGLKIYNNPSLAVALLALNDKGEVLLNKRRIPPHQDNWDTVGGFVSVGETVEQAVKREFEEETMAKCEVIRYWGSYPDTYGLEQAPTINLFFEVKVTAGKLIASDDAAELRFFSFEKLPKNLAFQNTKVFLDLLKKEKGKNDKQ